MQSRRSIAVILLAVAAQLSAFAAEPLTDQRQPVVLVTGANRGLGLEFVHAYAAQGWRVVATTRDPAKADELRAMAAANPAIVVEALDVGDGASIAALAERYKGKPIDVLLNNAGMLGELSRQSLTNLDYATFEEVMRVNTFGPMAVSRVFLDNVLASGQKKIVVITSSLSSIANIQRFGGYYFYRASKAALNISMRAIQADLRGRGLRVGILAPGVVETRLLRQSGYKGPGVISPQQSVAALIGLIDKLDQSADAKLYTGETLPW
jgi:NAD(P)-dependent dehydrogenase (short-subunit alcohol dehydrogenase family)